MKIGMRLSRRDFLKLIGVAALDLFLLAIGGVGYGLLMEPNSFKLETVRLKLTGLARSFSGLRLVQISDLHMGGWMNAARLQHVVDLVIDQKPDVLVITGDFLIGHGNVEISDQIVNDLIEQLSRLSNSIPSFAVLGNHDFWTNVETVRHVIASSGITDLTNAVSTLKRGQNSLHLCGVDDIWEGVPRLDHVIAQLSDNNAAILLAHEPDFADISAATGRFDLQLSGHTHGGQIVLPWVGPPILPYLGRKYGSGLYKV